MEKLYPNNYAWAGRTALMYNVFLDDFFDISYPYTTSDSYCTIKSTYSEKLTDVGLEYKKSTDTSYTKVSVVKDAYKGRIIPNLSYIGGINTWDSSTNAYISDIDAGSNIVVKRYNIKYNHIYPCRVMVTGLEQGATYDLRRYYVANNITQTDKEQSIALLSGTNTIVCNGFTFDSVPNELQKNNLQSGINEAISIMDAWFTGLKWTFTVTTLWDANYWSADSSMRYNSKYASDWGSSIDSARTITIHEQAHNWMVSTYNNQEQIIKFMEFATSVPRATWNWMGAHNYPIISSNHYTYIDDCLVAAACQLTRS